MMKLKGSELTKIVSEAIEQILREKENKKFNAADKEAQEIIDSMPDEMIAEVWNDYRLTSASPSYDNPLSLYVGTAITEGLIHTYPIGKTIEYVKEYFGLSDWQITEKVAQNGIRQIRVIIPNIGDNIKRIEEAMRLCGYYIGWPKEHIRMDNALTTIYFEPKIQEDSSEQIRSEEKVLFHITPYYNTKKIQAIGLSPRSKNELFNFPDRVYFLRGSIGFEEVKKVGTNLMLANKSEANDGRYTIFKIDLNKIPKNVKLHFDPNYLYGIYTTSNIRPDAIIDMVTINFKDYGNQTFKKD